MGDNRLASLTDREREVIRLIARNRGDGQIAELLHVSIHTVRTHIKNARGKVGGRDKYYLADALNDLEGRNPSLASPKNGIETHEPTPADERVPTVGTVREERASFYPDGYAAPPSSTRRRWGEDNDLRTLVIICLVMAIAVLIVQIAIHMESLAGAFKEFAAHLHQID